MVIFKLTPVRNVLINKRCYKSESIENFFNKVINEKEKIAVYDVVDRKNKELRINEINTRKHRIIINKKKFFICATTPYK